MGHVGEGQRRAKRDTFSIFDRDELAALALSLPESWVAAVDADGQLAILPADYVPHGVYVAVASGSRRAIRVSPWWWRRDDALRNDS
jgi:hypothetical protein